MRMVIPNEEQLRTYFQTPRPLAYDLTATFGDGQPGRIKKCIVDKYGKHHLGPQAWEAGDVAYQCLKQFHPTGIDAGEFTQLANEFLAMVSNEIYPAVLGLAEAGRLELHPHGLEGLKAAWAAYDWCERVIFGVDFFDSVMASDTDFDNHLGLALSLVLLERLSDAVIGDFLDGSGLADAMLEIGSLRDRIVPPGHVQRITEASRAAQDKLDRFKQARRKGADTLHVENRAMKADAFQWLDAQSSFKSIESAATAITKQQPIAHVTARDWYKEWKKLRSAGTP